MQGEGNVYIDEQGDLGLGISDITPTAASYNGATLQLHQTSSGNYGSQIKMTTASGGYSSGDGFYIAHWGGNSETYIYNKENTAIRFGTNSTERFSILNNGDVEISNGNLKFGSGHGIDFSVTTDASGNTSELLDDYEEGTWTPSYRYGANVNVTGNTNGEYIRIGNLVYFRGYIQNSYVAGGQSWQADIQGLPFTPNSGGYGIYAACAYGTNWSYNSGYYGIVAMVNESHPSVFLRANNAQGHNFAPTAYNMTNTTATYRAGCYHTLGF